MTDLNHLYGSCACERNQYTIIVPDASASLAQVFFDNSAANRRSQATPVTAWLRVPLDWYHSSTFSQYPDESHSSIKRTFNTPSTLPTLPPTRRQFCGYCGTHLTAWNEARSTDEDNIDVTLGSLLSESVERLEALNMLPADLTEDDGVDEESHIPEETAHQAAFEGSGEGQADRAVRAPGQSAVSHRMQNRGMPWFEEMVEDSRLGRIKRQKGGHRSNDGTRSVEWEVVEYDGADDEPMTGTAAEAAPTTGVKRQKLDG